MHTVEGQRVHGTIHVDESERVWRFIPSEAWDGDVRIIVDDALEDVAGNNFRDALDAVVSDAYIQPPATELLVPLRAAVSDRHGLGGGSVSD